MTTNKLYINIMISMTSTEVQQQSTSHVQIRQAIPPLSCSQWKETIQCSTPLPSVRSVCLFSHQGDVFFHVYSHLLLIMKSNAIFIEYNI